MTKRKCLCNCFRGMIMVFIDEADSIYYPSGYSAWNADVSYWRQLVAECGPPDFAAVFEVSGYPEYGIVPSGSSCPSGILKSSIARDPSLSQMISAYNACKGGASVPHPSEVVVCVDCSGSMGRSDMDPGLSAFITWLGNGGTSSPNPENPLPAIPYSEQHFSNERWLYLMNSWYAGVQC